MCARRQRLQNRRLGCSPDGPSPVSSPETDVTKSKDYSVALPLPDEEPLLLLREESDPESLVSERPLRA